MIKVSCRVLMLASLAITIVACSDDPSENKPLAGAYYQLDERVADSFESRVAGCQEILSPEQESKSTNHNRVGVNPGDDGIEGVSILNDTGSDGLHVSVFNGEDIVAEKSYSVEFLRAGESDIIEFTIDTTDYRLTYRGAIDCEGG